MGLARVMRCAVLGLEDSLVEVDVSRHALYADSMYATRMAYRISCPAESKYPSRLMCDLTRR